MSSEKKVYLFNEGRADMKSLLGGKGANLAEMKNMGLPVPSGMIITTKACIDYYNNGQVLSAGLVREVEDALRKLEEEVGKNLGSTSQPLLLSVRSGAVVSMPGMMDTILNLGLNRETVEGLGRLVGDRRFALDCYRRFIQMYGEVVMKAEYHHFDSIIEEEKEKKGYRLDTEMDEQTLENIIEAFQGVIVRECQSPFPVDPREQLFGAIKAVFDSWHTPRANVYRRANRISDDLGTAVNIQIMVFGNMGETSGTGVIFTRNPSNGENLLYGEYLMNAQGEDVVAGIRTPEPIAGLKNIMPDVYEQLLNSCKNLEKHYRDMQDIEFTIEEGKLYLLQTRNGKRTAASAVKIAVDMVDEGLINREEAVMRVKPEQLEQLLHRQIDPDASTEKIAVGLPASPGAAVGTVVFDADVAEQKKNNGEAVILVRRETTPDDIHGMIAAEGILTSRGGMTSHAAVVARGMGKPCVCGCEILQINEAACQLNVGDLLIKEGDYITIDGTTGRVIKGKVPMVEPSISGEFEKVLKWADQIRTMKVRANADTPEDARKAVELGAEGIGLCRTEHMFLSPERLPAVQEMILAEDTAQREAALAKLLPMQKEDFKGILKEMAGLPVTIRLLDPPLHEFLPNREELIIEVHDLKKSGQNDKKLKEKQALLDKANSLFEFNPMLGHRGCRLGVVYPEIYRMQARAILAAVIELIAEGMDAGKIKPEIMVPLVGHVKELEIMKDMIEEEIKAAQEKTQIKFSCPIGTMIEVPRACLTAGVIAGAADFFSFGTNDLTQMTFAFSRDDAEAKFLPFYIENKILPQNPFIEIDQEGVGGLIKMTVADGRQVKPEIKLGVCGEHGGNPQSVYFFHEVGLDYVSCSPFRVPVARLAAAQAVLASRQ